MKNSFKIFFKYTMFASSLSFTAACEREHLQPDIPETQIAPMVYISAVLDSDTVYFAGGVNSYIAEAFITDTLTWRYFNFYIYNEQGSPLQPRQCFKIYINNARPNLGIPEEDLDSTFVEGALGYQDYFSVFTPFAATVEWYDSAGVMFTSALVPQVTDFVITSVEDISFENKTYKKVTAMFECILIEGNNFNYKFLSNGRAVMLFGTD